MDTVALFALLVSIFAIAYTVYSNKRALKNTAFLNNLITIVNVEAQLGDVPSALKFHGVDPKELENIGVSSKEFAYLLTSFTVGGIYYKAYFPNDNEPFSSGSYRYEMCKSIHTRQTWPILKNFIDGKCYRAKIEKTINLINEAETDNAVKPNSKIV